MDWDTHQFELALATSSKQRIRYETRLVTNFTFTWRQGLTSSARSIKSDFWVPRKTSVVRQRHTHVWREYIRVTSMQNFTLEIRSKRTLALLVILQGNIPLRRQLASYFGGMAEHIPICRESARLGKIMSTLNDGVHVSALTKTLI